MHFDKVIHVADEKAHHTLNNHGLCGNCLSVPDIWEKLPYAGDPCDLDDRNQWFLKAVGEITLLLTAAEKEPGVCSRINKINTTKHLDDLANLLVHCRTVVTGAVDCLPWYYRLGLCKSRADLEREVLTNSVLSKTRTAKVVALILHRNNHTYGIPFWLQCGSDIDVEIGNPYMHIFMTVFRCIIQLKIRLLRAGVLTQNGSKETAETSQRIIALLGKDLLRVKSSVRNPFMAECKLRMLISYNPDVFLGSDSRYCIIAEMANWVSSELYERPDFMSQQMPTHEQYHTHQHCCRLGFIFAFRCYAFTN
jgi:hypothetical protein